MTIQELLNKLSFKQYLDKFFNRVHLRQLAKNSFPNILTEFDQLWEWKNFDCPILSGNTYPKLNSYLGIMTNQTLKIILNYYAKSNVENQTWYLNLKSKNGFNAYLSKIYHLAANRIVNQNDVFNSALVILAILETFNQNSQKFQNIFQITYDLNSDFDEIIFRVQQSMNALEPLKKMYLNWFQTRLPIFMTYFQNFTNDLQSTIYLNPSLNINKLNISADLVLNQTLFNFVYNDQTQLPSEFFDELFVNNCLWNFKNGQYSLTRLGILNLKHGILYLIDLEQLNNWLKKYFSLNLNDLVKKVVDYILKNSKN